MANAINIPKTHLIMGLSLPLAVLLGYFVAEPMELGSMAVVVFVLSVLATPLLIRGYYPLLVFAWNAAICLAFLPGRLALWAILAYVGLLLAVLSRAVHPGARFVVESSITKSLLALAGVVVATGMLTGGFGLAMLRSSSYGGKNYFYFLAAVAGYFVLTSRQIPPHRAGLYVALFFLSSLTYVLSDLAALAGAEYDWLGWILMPAYDVRTATLESPLTAPESLVRMGELGLVGITFSAYLLARFGVRGLLDLTRPWRLLLFFLALGMTLFSGFRSSVMVIGLTFALTFFLEGLHRTRYLPVLLGVVLLAGVVVLSRAEKLPPPVQRALTFLPGRFEYGVRENARSSSGWRVEMWKQLLPEVPRRLFRGKGWGIDSRDYFTAVDIGDAANPLTTAMLVGNYHNGPLSILIPFGLYGAIAFLCFLVAGLRVLHRKWKFGDPALRRVNGLLLAAFASKAVLFMVFFGSLHSDMAVFTGTLGLGVALNGAGASLAQAEKPATDMALDTEYVKA